MEPLKSDPLDQRFDYKHKPKKGAPRIVPVVDGYWALNPSEREIVDAFMKNRARHRDRLDL